MAKFSKFTFDVGASHGIPKQPENSVSERLGLAFLRLRDRMTEIRTTLGLTEEDLDRSEAWFDDRANRAVLICRCVPLMRSLISIPAGLAEPEGGDVLIIGAGSGNDVSAALQRDADRVDAVEIDGTLMEIAEANHPDRPYDDARVEVHIDDGRAFLERTDRKWDKILFALPDSLTLVPGQSSVRLESYLFTREDLKARLIRGFILGVAPADELHPEQRGGVNREDRQRVPLHELLQRGGIPRHRIGRHHDFETVVAGDACEPKRLLHP